MSAGEVPSEAAWEGPGHASLLASGHLLAIFGILCLVHTSLYLQLPPDLPLCLVTSSSLMMSAFVSKFPLLERTPHISIRAHLNDLILAM